MKDLITVIIPVYNVEAYLCECLDSVLSSTYSNLEIILVDDGSTDNCGSICDAYANKDARITVIHQENQGISEARNAGLAVAKGEFVAFVDSDDVISPVLYETLWWAINHENADIAACEYARDEERCEHCLNLSAENFRVVSGFDDCVLVFSGDPSSRTITWTGPMVWNKLYRREKINAKFCNQSEPAEDMQFNWEYANNCNKMVIVPQALYSWRVNMQSITQSPAVAKTVVVACVWINIVEQTHTASALLQRHLRHRAASSAHSALWQIIRENKESQYAQLFAQARYAIKYYFRELITHEDTIWKVKIIYMLYRYCYPAWKLAAKLHGFWEKRHRR